LLKKSRENTRGPHTTVAYSLVRRGRGRENGKQSGAQRINTGKLISLFRRKEAERKVSSNLTARRRKKTIA